MSASALVHRWRGAAALTLRAGELRATFLPEMNMLGVSLRLREWEALALPGGLAAYRQRRVTGIPLLAPWANRLRTRRYRAAGMRVNLDGLDLPTDDNGLPIHGTMFADTPWRLEALSTSGNAARVRAAFDHDQGPQFAAFPFPHRLSVEIRLDDRSLSIATTLAATGKRAVPVSFGYHPYLRLPGRRSTWRLRLPEREQMELDASGIPTGGRTYEPSEADPIGARTFDDLYALRGRGRLGIEGGGASLGVRFDAGYPYAQVYAPPGAGFVCLEPMTAPVNALVTGECPVVEPGTSFAARFSLHPRLIEPGRASG